SLSRQQPPIRRLAAVSQLELDPAVDHALDLAEGHRRPLAGQHADQLGCEISLDTDGECAQHGLQRLAWVAPCEDLVLHEADRLAAPEASLGIVAGGGGDGAGAPPPPPPVSPRSVGRPPAPPPGRGPPAGSSSALPAPACPRAVPHA